MFVRDVMTSVLILTDRRIPGNVAYGKPAVQTGAWGGLTADRAVDGLLYSDDVGNQHCAHPNTDSGPAVWTVDLQGTYKLYNVTIYNTMNSGGRK